MIDLTKAVFLLDGHTESWSFRGKFEADFGVKPQLRRVGCNGKDVTSEGYANAAYGTLLLALRSYFTSIICVLDRERRRQSAVKLSDQIKRAIVNRISSSTKYKKDELDKKIHICVPDIMFENWIVSDVDSIKEHNDMIDQDAEKDYYDGKSGTTVLKRMMKMPYKKTLHGPKLFKSTRFRTSMIYSPSFLNFATVLEL